MFGHEIQVVFPSIFLSWCRFVLSCASCWFCCSSPFGVTISGLEGCPYSSKVLTIQHVSSDKCCCFLFCFTGFEVGAIFFAFDICSRCCVLCGVASALWSQSVCLTMFEYIGAGCLPCAKFWQATENRLCTRPYWRKITEVDDLNRCIGLVVDRSSTQLVTVPCQRLELFWVSALSHALSMDLARPGHVNDCQNLGFFSFTQSGVRNRNSRRAGVAWVLPRRNLPRWPFSTLHPGNFRQGVSSSASWR